MARIDQCLCCGEFVLVSRALCIAKAGVVRSTDIPGFIRTDLLGALFRKIVLWTHRPSQPFLGGAELLVVREIDKPQGSGQSLVPQQSCLIPMCIRLGRK